MTPREALLAEMDRQITLLAALALMSVTPGLPNVGAWADWYLRERDRSAALLKMILSAM